MANEISLVSGLTVVKSGVSVSASRSKVQSMASTCDSVTHLIQDVDFSSAESIAYGDVDPTKECVLMLTNLDDTNYVIIFHTSVMPPIAIMRPGESYGPIRVAGGQLGSLHLQADTAACQVEVVVAEASDPAA
jgi:type 1 glutamine amidotransferase